MAEPHAALVVAGQRREQPFGQCDGRPVDDRQDAGAGHVGKGPAGGDGHRRVRVAEARGAPRGRQVEHLAAVLERQPAAVPTDDGEIEEAELLDGGDGLGVTFDEAHGGDGTTLPRALALPFRAVVAVPWLFVLLWSTGFIGARLVVGEADPLAVLTVRFALACACALVIALVTRARWMGWRMAGHVSVVGMLLHGVYLGGVFGSIAEGLPAGLSALIVGLQPIVTACLVGALLGERVARLQWIGFAAGLVGIALVLWERLSIGGVGFGAIALSLLSLAAITAGALYQKRFCTGIPIWPAAVVQYAAATVLVAVGSALFEDSRIEWTPKVLGGLAWMVLVLSIGAVSLLMLVIRSSSAAQTASLLYLTPPLAALEAYIVFGEELHALAIAGLGVAALGVFLVMRGDPAGRVP